MLTTFVVWCMVAMEVRARVRVVGWWDGKTPSLESAKFPWTDYTHIRYGGPVVFPDGHAKCNKTQMERLTTMAHAHNLSVLWSPRLDGQYITDGTTPMAYWESIGSAVEECDVDGIEVDYEHTGPWGIVTSAQANRYTDWLATLRRYIRKPVSADISTPGLAPGNWILGWGNWINATRLNRGDFDYVNSMSYHWSRDNDIFAWKKDIWVMIQRWGIDPARINLGLPLYSKRWLDGRVVSEPTWGSLSPSCPRIPLDQTTCDDVLVVSKQMAMTVGELVRKHSLGGMFPWALSYDAYGPEQNALVPYLHKGYHHV